MTTTPRRLADLVISHIEAGFPDGGPFDVTVCGDEVPARKPDPAPYLQAMAALGVSPEECVVIEDSLVGVTSGLAAGAAVIGVAGAAAGAAGAGTRAGRHPGRHRTARAGRRARRPCARGVGCSMTSAVPAV